MWLPWWSEVEALNSISSPCRTEQCTQHIKLYYIKFLFLKIIKEVFNLFYLIFLVLVWSDLLSIMFHFWYKYHNKEILYKRETSYNILIYWEGRDSRPNLLIKPNPTPPAPRIKILPQSTLPMGKVERSGFLGEGGVGEGPGRGGRVRGWSIYIQGLTMCSGLHHVLGI